MNIIQIIAFIIIILILISCFRRSKNKRLYELLKQFPSHPTYPLIGNAHMLFGSFEGILERFEKIFVLSDRLLFWFGPTPMLFLKKHDDIATILNQTSYRDYLGTVDEWLGTGILNAKYKEWIKSRKMLTPAFSSNMFIKYAEVFERNSLDLVETFKPFAKSGKELNVWDLLMEAHLDAITENTLGISVQAKGKFKNEFCIAVEDAINLVIKRFQYPWLLLHYINMLYLIMIGKVNNIHNLQHYPTMVLKQSIKRFRDSHHDDNVSNNADTSKAVIDLLVRYHFKEPSVTETRMRDELLHMMGPAVETSPAAMSFLMLILAMNSDIQQKAYEEVLKFKTDDGRLNPYDINNNMPFIDQCVKESLRMFCPVAIVTRRVHKDILLKDNVVVPANTYVAAFIHFVNYDSDLYNNPDKFDPEHFSEQAIEARPKTSQLTFGYGPRSCIAGKYSMNFIRIQIAYILLNYHLSTSVKEFTKEHLMMELGIKSKIGYPITFTLRRYVG